MDTFAILVNGERRETPAGLSVLGLLEHLLVDPSRVAVELNRYIVRKTAWPDTVVPDGAHVEIVQFVGGG